MPTYEYRCPEGHEFERFQKMTEPPRARCPECGRMARRMISGGAGLIFKGSGFYITDYGKDGKGPRVETDKHEKADKAGTADKADKTDKADKADKADTHAKKDSSEKKSAKKKADS